MDISETSTEYTQADDPIFPNEWRYNKEVPRRSFRIQIKHTQTTVMKRAQKRKAEGSSTSGGNPLLDTFPYLRLTHDQVEQLFRIYNIVLGNSPQDRDVLIPAIQNMDRVQFESLLQSLHFNRNDTVIQLNQDHLHLDTDRDSVSAL